MAAGTELAAWAPLIGSTVIALATLATLYFTVRQSNKSLRLAAEQHAETLEKADQREWIHWKRTKIAEYCEQILTSGFEASSQLNSAHVWSVEAEPFHRSFWEVSGHMAQIPRARSNLRIVVGDALDDYVQSVQDSLSYALQAAVSERQFRSGGQLDRYDEREGFHRMQLATSDVVRAMNALSTAGRALMESSDPATEDSRPSGPEPEDT
ncbi:hypothetical protein [Gordonia sp. X0973]|uniref:hypothetical protein n=1 Tax=Gordonia sp. X0973 TaxID=2742602 RepID=UPI0026573EF8|nr:hypothetical protein [Gordonia sp. X0973]